MISRFAPLAAAIVLACATAPIAAQKPPAVVTVIKAGTVIDGTGAPPIANGAVIVTGDTITWVGRAADLRMPDAARLVDLGRKTLLPGLFDCHDHITECPATAATHRRCGKPTRTPPFTASSTPS
jgi:imidazolonepropionase-like amidohydrolase